MSNKTKLATNNTQLASLIQELQGKAAGGGGGMQTATVTSTVKRVIVPDTIWYLSPNGVESFQNDTDVTFQCVVPSIIVRIGPETHFGQLSGDITPLDNTVQYASIYSITGDASFISFMK